ncbi:MAG: hypothetical protein JSS34_02340 [Proteobacteria bacterium]|nr:hypothetical protein [Pseudomonadota bacterium]
MLFRKILKKKIFFLSLLQLIAFHSAFAGIVFFQDMDIYNENQKRDLFKRASCPFPDLEEIRRDYPGLSCDFVPDTTLQVLIEPLLKQPELRLSYSRLWDNVFPENLKNYTDLFFITNLHFTRFFILNNAFQSFAKTQGDLILAARGIVARGIPLAGTFLTIDLYARIIAKELEAFQNHLTLFWNVAYDSEDAVLHKKDTPLRKFLPQDGKLCEGSFSYGVRPLDGLLRMDYRAENFQLESPFTNGAPLTHMRHYAHFEKKEGVVAFLYCLAIPHTELEELAPYVYDARALNFFQLGLDSKGPTAQHQVFFRKKRDKEGKGITLYDWGVCPQEEAYKLEDKNMRKTLIKSWYRWMGLYLDILSKDGHVLTHGQEVGTQKFYRTFYEIHLDAVLASKLDQ